MLEQEHRIYPRAVERIAGPCTAELTRAEQAVGAQRLPEAAVRLEAQLAETPDEARARFLMARVLAWSERWPAGR